MRSIHARGGRGDNNDHVENGKLQPWARSTTF
jgi:hypothetical protein